MLAINVSPQPVAHRYTVLACYVCHSVTPGCLVPLEGLEPSLTANLANREYKSRRASYYTTEALFGGPGGI